MQCTPCEKPAKSAGEGCSKTQINDQRSDVKNVPVSKPALLVENQGPAGAGDIVGAGVASEDRDQAAVRGEMRKRQVEGEENNESNDESD